MEKELQEEYNNACLLQQIIKAKGEAKYYATITEDEQLKKIYNDAEKRYRETAKELTSYISAKLI